MIKCIMKKLFNKVSLPYLIFIIICLLGCLYHIIQVSDVYFKFATKTDVTIDNSNQIVIPLVTFCKSTNHSLKIPLKNGLTPAKLYNYTYDLSEIFFYCKFLNNNSKKLEFNNCANLTLADVQLSKTINDKYICYNFKHPQFSKNISRVQEIIYTFMFYHFDQTEFWLYLTPEHLYPTGFSWKSYMLLGGHRYVVAFTRLVTNLLPTPYATNCFDYSKIGCQSKSECIDQCKVELSLKQCNVLPSFVNMDKSNDRDKYEEKDKEIECKKRVDNTECDEKYKSNDCSNQYYELKLLVGDVLDDIKLNFLSKNYPQYNSSLVSSIDIAFHDDPDTIYHHSPQQHFVEFACYIGGVIALWTGFSVMSLYAVGQRLFINQLFINQIKRNNQRRKSNDSQKILFKRNSRINQNNNSGNYNQGHYNQGYYNHFNDSVFYTFPYQKTSFS